MYSKTAWGGPVDPFIQIKFLREPVEGDADPVVSLVLFEWRDQNYIGVSNDDGTQQWVWLPLARLGGHKDAVAKVDSRRYAKSDYYHSFATPAA